MRALNKFRSSKRGDTIIEVIFAITIFSMVAIISVSMMNSGIYSAENALEVVTARNELNAQAEALRFVHSSYISEMTLPDDGGVATSVCLTQGEKCRQYHELWNTIIDNALDPNLDETSDVLNIAETAASNGTGCERIYSSDSGPSWLAKNKAFILNTRDLSALQSGGSTYKNDVGISYLSAVTNPYVFIPASLGARVIYTTDAIFNLRRADPTFTIDTDLQDNSTQYFTDGQTLYNRVAFAEGIWVIAVKGAEVNASGQPTYYDFYIESCWYGPNTKTPNTIDTVIRLYNPEGI